MRPHPAPEGHDFEKLETTLLEEEFSKETAFFF